MDFVRVHKDFKVLKCEFQRAPMNLDGHSDIATHLVVALPLLLLHQLSALEKPLDVTCIILAVIEMCVELRIDVVELVDDVQLADTTCGDWRLGAVDVQDVADEIVCAYSALKRRVGDGIRITRRGNSIS